MSEPLTSFLTGTWNLDTEQEIQIIFYENGTGELILRHIFNAWIAAETEWKILYQAPIPTFTDPHPEPHLLAEFTLSLTLTPRPITTRGPTDEYILNAERLFDTAFVPKTFTVRLEKGAFKTAFEKAAGPVRSWASSYMYRLVFDQSPFPEREEWRDQDDVPEPPFLRMDGWREFCGRAIERGTSG
ncbi:hypothetical protein BO71DRAFT_449650 [Aspergillus ellipticus CBS 707.79]|uniref:Uncharacterized protein n=1 Tax=Aspergillus ellipticus CBS 707.79 TaxID=1448320 RepID=A0A319DCH9_9EURO|nr:hypothetical protein BO71DRAFT_449650 [Aspergillus ellipticus CBS 707.79]